MQQSTKMKKEEKHRKEKENVKLLHSLGLITFLYGAKIIQKRRRRKAKKQSLIWKFLHRKKSPFEVPNIHYRAHSFIVSHEVSGHFPINKSETHY